MSHSTRMQDFAHVYLQPLERFLIPKCQKPNNQSQPKLNQNQSNCLITFNTKLITALNLPISVQFSEVREGSVPYQQLHSLQMPGCTAPMQRSDTVLVLMIQLRAMFNQHCHELHKPTMSSTLQWSTATNKQKTKKQIDNTSSAISHTPWSVDGSLGISPTQLLEV